jgi:hypothetical protein
MKNSFSPFDNYASKLSNANSFAYTAIDILNGEPLSIVYDGTWVHQNSLSSPNTYEGQIGDHTNKLNQHRLVLNSKLL